MPELIDRQAVLKKMCETCGYCEKFEKAMRSTHPDFVTEKCNNYKFLSEQPTIELGMNTAKIAKLCNEIEDIACHIGNITMNDVVYAEAQMIFDKVKEIGKELTVNVPKPD